MRKYTDITGESWWTIAVTVDIGHRPKDERTRQDGEAQGYGSKCVFNGIHAVALILVLMKWCAIK